MADADPFANDPYDRLAVSKSDSFKTIKSEAERLMEEYMQKAQNASSQSEKDRYTDAFNNLQDAFGEIKQNALRKYVVDGAQSCDSDNRTLS